jgi:predicted dehydrogenase
MSIVNKILFCFIVLLACSCQQAKEKQSVEASKQAKFIGAKDEVKIMTLDPGHFHAALVQKFMYEQVDSIVNVFAPNGLDVDGHLARIEGFNNRVDNPTSWKEKVYRGNDFFERMIAEKPGNVMIVSGNNAKKTEYILNAVKEGINVLADKPMIISPEKFEQLKEAFEVAEENGVLLYDIMTERYEISTILQKNLSQIPNVFGQLEEGSLENPSVTKESVHHFFKYVSGNPLVRPSWFFDVSKQGEGIVDVNTHLVDLIQWECFPEQIIDYEKDIEIITAKRWPTKLTASQFKRVTNLDDYPQELLEVVNDDSILNVYSNGEINYRIKGIHAKASVIWNYEAQEEAKDTHYSIMRGTRSDLVIRQGKEQNYKPMLYVEAINGIDIAAFEQDLNEAIAAINRQYSGVGLEKFAGGWIVTIPDKYKLGHEAHFTQVTEKYLEYLKDGKLPDWEVPNMLAKYYTTTQAYIKSQM